MIYKKQAESTIKWLKKREASVKKKRRNSTTPGTPAWTLERGKELAFAEVRLRLQKLF